MSMRNGRELLPAMERGDRVIAAIGQYRTRRSRCSTSLPLLDVVEGAAQPCRYYYANP